MTLLEGFIMLYGYALAGWFAACALWLIQWGRKQKSEADQWFNNYCTTLTELDRWRRDRDPDTGRFL